MPGQRLGHGRGTARAARLPPPGQVDGVPLARDGRPDERQAGRAGASGQPSGPLHVQRLRGFLQVLERGRASAEPQRPRARRGPQRPQLRFRAPRRAPQATGPHGLQPLASLDSALAPRHVLAVLRMDGIALEAPRFQTLRPRNPTRARRCPGDGRHPAGGQPVGPGIEGRREGPEGPHRLGLALLGHTRPALLAADVQTGRVGVAPGERNGSRPSWAACAPGKPSIARGQHSTQTWSGLLQRTSSPGPPPSPSEAANHDITPAQNPSRQRAVHHTSVCTLFACRPARQQDTARAPRFCLQADRITVWESRQNILDAGGE
jgi:hypothetical protein